VSRESANATTNRSRGRSWYQTTIRVAIDRFELAAFATLATLSLWVLGLDLWQVIAHGRVWTGTDGVYPGDQLQYLAWIRSASVHVLASDLFVIRPTPTDYLQPAIAISGGLSALGMAPWLSFLLWKPIAVVAFFAAVRAFVRRSLAGRWERRAALVLGLFFSAFPVIGDLYPPFWSWGYPFGLIATAALPAALLAYDRARTANRLSLAPALLGALASWLHPWQGETLIAIVIAAELLAWRGVLASGSPRGRHTLAAATVIGTALPVVYLAALDRFDHWWHLARAITQNPYPLSRIALDLAALALPAALAYRSRPRDFLALATRIWPLAALAVYAFCETPLGATPLHAFAGVTVPLGILAVEGVQQAGWGRLPHPVLLGALAVAAATIPSGVEQMSQASGDIVTAGNGNYITSSEHRALEYLAADREPGGVLARYNVGVVTPADTGRRTYIGDCAWSPDCSAHEATANAMFGGSLTAAATRAFVLGSGARFVVSDCQARVNLTRPLAPITRSVHRFGCAAVYEVQ